MQIIRDAWFPRQALPHCRGFSKAADQGRQEIWQEHFSNFTGKGVFHVSLTIVMRSSSIMPKPRC